MTTAEIAQTITAVVVLSLIAGSAIGKLLKARQAWYPKPIDEPSHDVPEPNVVDLVARLRAASPRHGESGVAGARGHRDVVGSTDSLHRDFGDNR